MSRAHLAVAGLAAALLAVAPLFLNAYQVDVLNSIGLYALLALSLNLILGEAGLFNMGHAAFYAMGAYTAAILNTRYQIPILWTLPASGAVAGAFALLVARPVVHLRGDYLMIVTIGVGEIVRIALVNDVFGITATTCSVSPAAPTASSASVARSCSVSRFASRKSFST